MTKLLGKRDQIDFLLRRRFGSLAPPPVTTLGGARNSVEAAMDEAARKRSYAISGKTDPRRAIDTARAEYEAMTAGDIQRLVDETHAEMTHAWEQEQSRIAAKRNAAWPTWARQDLWSHAEFAQICCGRVPGEPNRTDVEQIAINWAAEAIARGTHSGALKFVPRDDADIAARMYGTHRHYVPAIAAEWAATRFETFPPALKDEIALRQQITAVSVASSDSWPWGSYDTPLLRHLAEAAERFWKRYDPAEPDTAPTNDTVSAWLEGKGVAKRTAQTMASILRAEGLRTGPRR